MVKFPTRQRGLEAPRGGRHRKGACADRSRLWLAGFKLTAAVMFLLVASCVSVSISTRKPIGCLSPERLMSVFRLIRKCHSGTVFPFFVSFLLFVNNMQMRCLLETCPRRKQGDCPPQRTLVARRASTSVDFCCRLSLQCDGIVCGKQRWPTGAVGVTGRRCQKGSVVRPQ